MCINSNVGKITCALRNATNTAKTTIKPLKFQYWKYVVKFQYWKNDYKTYKP